MIPTTIISVIIINGSQFLYFFPLIKANISSIIKIKYIIAKYIVTPIFIPSRNAKLIRLKKFKV